MGVAFYLMLALAPFCAIRAGLMSVASQFLTCRTAGSGSAGDSSGRRAAGRYNRILTWQGMSRIRAGKCRPGLKRCWKWQIAMRKNSPPAIRFCAGATSQCCRATGRYVRRVALLLCDNIGEARVLANELMR